MQKPESTGTSPVGRFFNRRLNDDHNDTNTRCSPHNERPLAEFGRCCLKDSVVCVGSGAYGIMASRAN